MFRLLLPHKLGRLSHLGSIFATRLPFKIRLRLIQKTRVLIFPSLTSVRRLVIWESAPSGQVRVIGLLFARPSLARALSSVGLSHCLQYLLSTALINFSQNKKTSLLRRFCFLSFFIFYLAKPPIKVPKMSTKRRPIIKTFKLVTETCIFIVF